MRIVAAGFLNPPLVIMNYSRVINVFVVIRNNKYLQDRLGFRSELAAFVPTEMAI